MTTNINNRRRSLRIFQREEAEAAAVGAQEPPRGVNVARRQRGRPPGPGRRGRQLPAVPALDPVPGGPGDDPAPPLPPGGGPLARRPRGRPPGPGRQVVNMQMGNDRQLPVVPALDHVRGVADPLPGVADPVPGVADPVPGVADPVPGVADPVPGVADPVPGGPDDDPVPYRAVINIQIAHCHNSTFNFNFY